MIWFPAAFLTDSISFQAVDDSSARVTLTDHGRAATGTLFIDQQGRLTDFVARRFRARDHQIFTGKLTRKHLSFPDRAMASAVRAAEGDFRNWADIRAWATGIADTLLA